MLSDVRCQKWPSLEPSPGIPHFWKLLIAFFILIVISLPFIISSSIKSSDAYKLALSKAVSHATVIQLIGEPIETGFLATELAHKINMQKVASICCGLHDNTVCLGKY